MALDVIENVAVIAPLIVAALVNGNATLDVIAPSWTLRPPATSARVYASIHDASAWSF